MSISTLVLICVVVVAVLLIATAATAANRSVIQRERVRRHVPTTSEKKKEPLSVSKVLKQMLMGAVVVILLLFLARLVLSFFSEDDKNIGRKRGAHEQAQLVDTVPSYRIGEWKIMLGNEYSTKFCPPGNSYTKSYTKIKWEDNSVGITTWTQLEDGIWSKPVYRPPNKDFEFGQFICMRIKSDEPTILKVIISKTKTPLW